jgi:pilus assembly protein CpaE
VAKTPAALIVDQDVQARYEMKQVVRACGLTLAGECGYGVEALSAANEARPDVIIVAVNEPVERPLQTVDALLSLLPETPVVVYSDAKDLETVRRAMLAGARDFLPRPVRPEVLRDSVLKAMALEENRRLRAKGELPAQATAGTIITVFGPKGGIGKSTLSTNLAVSLARQGTAPVAVVDLDNGFGDITGMLDVHAEKTLVDLIRDLDKLGREDVRKYLATHAQSGLEVLAAPSLLEWREIDPDDVRRALEKLAQSYDKIVIDTGGALNGVTEAALELATIVLWVTTTEFASVRDSIEAMRALRQLNFPHERMRVVVNSIFPDDTVRASAVQDAMQTEIFWQVPYEKKVRQGTHLGQPIVVTAPNSVAARSFEGLAAVISGGKAGASTNGHGSAKSLFRWRSGPDDKAAAPAAAPAEGS